MSKPRKPFGSVHPGRLPATMVKVLAAEMSDPARLRRGKQYASDGSVLDIVIERGIVTCEIQGSRSTPYIAAIEVTAGDGMPLRRDVRNTCTCPDDDNWDGHACKHVIAALFALSNEFLLEPELLDVWRGNDGADPRPSRATGSRDEPDPPDDAPDDTPSRGRRRHLSLVRPLDERPTRPRPDTDRTRERVDSLAPLLGPPGGTDLPEIPVLEPVDLPLPRHRELAGALRDALLHLHVEWD